MTVDGVGLRQEETDDVDGIGRCWLDCVGLRDVR
jgi:hypothetical protein